MWHNTTLGDNDVAEKLLKSERMCRVRKEGLESKDDSLFVVSNGELQVTRHNTLLLVITGGVASKFENLSGEIFQNSC
jgi:hypothetical protein